MSRSLRSTEGGPRIPPNIPTGMEPSTNTLLQCGSRPSSVVYKNNTKQNPSTGAMASSGGRNSRQLFPLRAVVQKQTQKQNKNNNKTFLSNVSSKLLFERFFGFGTTIFVAITSGDSRTAEAIATKTATTNPHDLFFSRARSSVGQSVVPEWRS